MRYWSIIVGCLFMVACSDHEEDTVREVPKVKTAIGLSLPTTIVGQKTPTRQDTIVVQRQSSVASFRGMDHIRLISFDHHPETGSPNIGGVLTLPSVPSNGLGMPGILNYRVFEDQYVPIGTTRLLFYGKAIDKTQNTPLTTADDKFYYGQLNVAGMEENDFHTTSDIVVTPTSIADDSQPFCGSQIGPNLVGLLNELLTTEVSGSNGVNTRWSTTESKALRMLYDEFTQLRTCSSALVERFLDRLYAKLATIYEGDQGYPLARQLMTTITNACDGIPNEGGHLSLSASYQGFPEDINLPAGAARILFDGQQFQEAMSISNGGLNNDYVYPASLWYTVTSPIVASKEVQSRHYDDAATWSAVITQVYDSRLQEVNATTQSIAMINQIEYAVGRLETQVQMNSGKFYDATGHSVDVSQGFELKGLIIGGQMPVGWSFRPITPDQPNTSAIYDRHYTGKKEIRPGEVIGTNHTLVLETPVNRSLYVVLELVNRGQDFVGADGIIPSGGTFYLLSEFDPRKSEDYHAGVLDRVFQQDYVTYATIHILNGWPDTNGDGVPDRPSDADPDDKNEGLSNATNGIPDLNSPHTYELGLSVDLNWQKGLHFEPVF